MLPNLKLVAFLVYTCLFITAVTGINVFAAHVTAIDGYNPVPPGVYSSSGTVNSGETLYIGTGAQDKVSAKANMPQVIVSKGNIVAQSGTIQTAGADLIMQNGGIYSPQNSFRPPSLNVWNGNVDIKTTSQTNSTHLDVLSVSSGWNFTHSGSNFVIVGNLDLASNATVVNTDRPIQIQTQLNNNKNMGGMQAGSLVKTASDIEFGTNKINSESPDPNDDEYKKIKGINGASGILRAGGSIFFQDLDYDCNYIQGSDGHLTLDAGFDIIGSEMQVDNLNAGNNIIAGTVGKSGDITINSLSPTKSIQSGNIDAGNLLAAGEISDEGINTGKPSIVKASHMLVVKNNGDNASSGNFRLKNGFFVLTSESPVGNAEYGDNGAIISHREASWVGGDMDVNNTGASSFTSLGVKGNTRIAGGTLSGDTLNTGSAQLHNGLKGTINNLNMTDRGGGGLKIGGSSDSGLTQVSINNYAQNSTDLTVGAGAGSAQAAISKIVIDGVGGNRSDGDIYVVHNGMLALGTSNTNWLPAYLPLAGVSADAAILGIAAPVTLGYSLTVDSARSQTARSGRMRAGGGITFGNNSLLVIDGAQKGVNYSGTPIPTAGLPDNLPGAISSATPAQANVASGARIYIDHVTPGHTYIALGKNITTRYEDDTAWSGDNLRSSNPLLGFERLGNGKEGQFSVVEHAPQTKHIAISGGVPKLTRAASEAMEAAIYHRIRLGEEDLYRRNWALWALPIYEHIDKFGLDGGENSYGFKGGIGGLAFGCDYTWQDTIRVGLAMNIGAGYSQSTGDDVASTKNNMNFWGIGAYGVWKPGAFSLDADIDFTSSYNKLKQELPSGLRADSVKGDAQAYALGMSLRAQYEFDTDWLIIRPHFGVRYFHLNTAPYDITMNGEDVIRSHRYYQNVWTFPIGIVFTKNIKLGDGYEITPLLNLKAIPASGDIYVKNSIRYAGAHRDTEFKAQVMDQITYGGRAGLEFRANDLSIGINYTAQFGSHTSNQGVFGVLRYEF